MKDEEGQPISYRRIFSMILPIFRKNWKNLPFFVVMAGGVAAVTLSEPYIYGSIIDRVTSAVQRHTSVSFAFQSLSPFLIAWACLVIFGSLLFAIFSYLRGSYGSVLANNLGIALYERMLRLDVRHFQEKRGGEMLRRFNNPQEGIFSLFNHVVNDYLIAFFLFSFALGYGLWIDWRLTLVALVPVPIVVGVAFWNLKRVEPAQQATEVLWDEVSGFVGDSFTNITTTKAFSGEISGKNKLEKLYALANVRQNSITKLWATGDAILGGAHTAGRLAIFLVGTWLVLSGQTTLGTLIMFLGFLSSLYGAVSQSALALPEVTRALSRLSRGAELSFETPNIRELPTAKTVKRLHGNIVFDHVTYGYQKGSTVLNDISFTIPEGRTIALVGESGAGKSTLAQLLLRFFDPTEGRVLVNGIDIRELTLKSLRSNVGFVMQENLLFHDTILNNILFARPGASKQDVIDAAKRAQAHEFVSRLKKGYQTMVGERGVKLSGGEKQRIALARVLLADPPILVLDEATSALDSKTEHALQVALHEVVRNRSTLVIAHRLSTVMQADQIIVMDHGKIADHGKHEELIRKEGLYKQYWEIQAGGYV